MIRHATRRRWRSRDRVSTPSPATPARRWQGRSLFSLATPACARSLRPLACRACPCCSRAATGVQRGCTGWATGVQRVCTGCVPAVYRLCNVRVRVDRRLPHAPQHFLATIAYLRGVNLRGFANPSHPHFYGQQNADHWCICVYIRESHARMQMSLWMYMPLRRPEMMYAYIDTDSDRGRLGVEGRSLVHMRVGTYIIRTYADARGSLHLDLLPSWPSGPICSSSVFTLSPSVCTLSSRLRTLVR